jgi:hypothetical protein
MGDTLVGTGVVGLVYLLTLAMILLPSQKKRKWWWCRLWQRHAVDHHSFSFILVVLLVLLVNISGSMATLG